MGEHPRTWAFFVYRAPQLNVSLHLNRRFSDDISVKSLAQDNLADPCILYSASEIYVKSHTAPAFYSISNSNVP